MGNVLGILSEQIPGLFLKRVAHFLHGCRQLAYFFQEYLLSLLCLLVVAGTAASSDIQGGDQLLGQLPSIVSELMGLL